MRVQMRVWGMTSECDTSMFVCVHVRCANACERMHVKMLHFCGDMQHIPVRVGMLFLLLLKESLLRCFCQTHAMRLTTRRLCVTVEGDEHVRVLVARGVCCPRNTPNSPRAEDGFPFPLCAGFAILERETHGSELLAFVSLVRVPFTLHARTSTSARVRTPNRTHVYTRHTHHIKLIVCSL